MRQPQQHTAVEVAALGHRAVGEVGNRDLKDVALERERRGLEQPLQLFAIASAEDVHRLEVLALILLVTRVESEKLEEALRVVLPVHSGSFASDNAAGKRNISDGWSDQAVENVAVL